MARARGIAVQSTAGALQILGGDTQSREMELTNLRATQGWGNIMSCHVISIFSCHISRYPMIGRYTAYPILILSDPVLLYIPHQYHTDPMPDLYLDQTDNILGGSIYLDARITNFETSQKHPGAANQVIICVQSDNFAIFWHSYHGYQATTGQHFITRWAPTSYTWTYLIPINGLINGYLGLYNPKNLWSYILLATGTGRPCMGCLNCPLSFPTGTVMKLHCRWSAIGRCKPWPCLGETVSTLKIYNVWVYMPTYADV